jgi:hypothetical protein
MVFIEETTQVVSNSLGPCMNHIRQSLSKRTYATTSLEGSAAHRDSVSDSGRPSPAGAFLRTRTHLRLDSGQVAFIRGFVRRNPRSSRHCELRRSSYMLKMRDSR